MANGLGAACLFSLVVALPVLAGEPIAGSVKIVKGGAVVHRGPQDIPIQQGMHLLVDDVLRTSADGRVGVILQDGTRISIGPATELKIKQFLYEPERGKFGLVLSLVRGVLTYVSGKIADFAPGTVSVETPVGIAGLRGTHFAVSLEGAQQ